LPLVDNRSIPQPRRECPKDVLYFVKAQFDTRMM
jgi:hypothetical protein